jgi:Uncharacterized protein conserved in bacteria (DUF2147)
MVSRLLVRCLLPIGALAMIGAAAAAPAVDLAGYYRMPANSQIQNTQDGVVIVAVYRCATGEFCGRIAARGGLPEADLRNPEPVARARSLCGLDILSVEDPAGLDKAAVALRGTLYDPRTGDDSAIEIYAGQNGDLHVTGHAGRPILSRTYVRREEVWQRVTPPAGACEQVGPTS